MKIKVIGWDRDATPYPKKGQVIQNVFGERFKVLLFNKKLLKVTLEVLPEKGVRT